MASGRLNRTVGSPVPSRTFFHQEQSHGAEDLEQEVFVDVVQGQSNGEADSLDEEFNSQDEEEVESEVESLDDSDYDEGWDWSTVLPPRNPQVHGSSLVSYEEAGTDTRRTFFCDFDNEDGDSSDLETPPGSDSESDVGSKTCSCRRWDLTGIPCSHAISCMFFNNKNPEEYVSYWYRYQRDFLKTYDHIILPSNGPQLWPASLYPPINPPFMRRAPGRPKKARIKTNDEPTNPYTMRRNQNTIRCTRCGDSCHNVRTCSGKTAADRVIPTGGNKDHPQVLHPEQRVRGGRGGAVGAGVGRGGPIGAEVGRSGGAVGAGRGQVGRGRAGRSGVGTGRAGRGGAVERGVGSQIEGNARKKQKVVQGTQESKNA
ncbi:hypothetical protein OROMI_032270 [Orobanche minor]